VRYRDRRGEESGAGLPANLAFGCTRFALLGVANGPVAEFGPATERDRHGAAEQRAGRQIG